MINRANKIELHYFFRDESHAMNAFIRNDCEKELLTIFKEIIASLDINVDIESEALTEGGLREIWKFLGKNGVQITLILTIVGLLLSRIPVGNKELLNLQIENLKLDNEIKRQKLKKIKNEIKSDEDLTEDVVERVIEILDNDYKIIWHKSNFYKKLNQYPKITKLTTRKLNEHNEPVESEKPIERQQFRSFILRSDTFPPNRDEDAVIDIISPVLKKGNFSWKGFYNGEIINFEMADTEFKNSVLNKEIEFVNGTTIKCVLHQSRKIDETGLIKIVQSKVLTVFEINTSDNLIATEQGKKYKYDKNLKYDQLSLNF